MVFSEALKKEARRKAHYQCVFCRRADVFVEVHHIVPEEDGGPDTLENACSLCPTCHDSYGGNPKKRTRLKEMRDWWWESCARQESNPVTAKVLEILGGMDRRHDADRAEMKEEIERLRTILIEYYQHDSTAVERVAMTESATDLIIESGNVLHTEQRAEVGSYGWLTDRDECPVCHKGQLKFLHWGPSPFGSFGAWFICPECGENIPSPEVFGD
jgi:hypothetical protein